MHAEFKLNDDPALFLMPSRFSVELDVNKNFTLVRKFVIQLPVERVYNCLIECGNLFSSIGDDEKPSLSPDDRRQSEYRLILRPSSNEYNETAAIDSYSLDDAEQVQETFVDVAQQFDLEPMDKPKNFGFEELPESLDFALPEASDIAVSMGGLQFHPGGDSEVVETAVQEILFPQMRLELVEEAPSQAARLSPSLVYMDPQEAQDKLAVAMYPFLHVGYSTDYLEAARVAAAAGKPLMAVVLWGALDDASC